MDGGHDIFDSLGISTTLPANATRLQLLDVYRYELGHQSDVERLHAIVKQCLSILRGGLPDMTRMKCRQQLKDLQALPDTTQVDNAIDIAVRLWLMIDSRDDIGTGYPRHWAETETINEVICSRFPQAPASEPGDVNRFPRSFRAVDLERLSGIEIQWTTYLDEHLRFDDENRTLKIFNDKAWLLAVLNSAIDEKATTGLPHTAKVGLPQELLEETIRTLDVLFPPWHDRTVKFLDGLGEDFYQLPPIPRDLPRLRHFSYWRERLIDVIVEFESPPRNWKHVWRDRRYPMAFWTFWLGLLIFILTFLFGFLGTLIAGLALKASEQQLKQGISG